MIKMLTYYEYIKETKMDIERPFLLFSDIIRNDYDKRGGKYPMFYDFYGDSDIFYCLVSADNEIATLRGIFQNCRFTKLGPTTYKDTESLDNKKLSRDEVINIMRNSNDYYFYRLGVGPRNENEAPDREHVVELVDHDGEKWIWVIKKNISCNLVKTKSRQEGGNWAEHQLVKYDRWTKSHHDIKLRVRKNDVAIEANDLLKNIFYMENTDIFTIEDVEKTFIKYDIIIDQGLQTEKLIEVKQYKNSEKDIWTNGKPKKLMLAEQCKIASRKTLKKIVEWYNDAYKYDKRSYEYIESYRLKNLSEREIHNEFAIKIKDKNDKWVHNPMSTEICDKIRDFYNDKLDDLLKVFNDVRFKDRWMAGVYGIYFAGPSRQDRRNDFLIRFEEDDHSKNIKFKWEIVTDWVGFKRIKLFAYISGNAWEYILTEGNNFEKVFQLKNYKKHVESRNDGVLQTSKGVFRYNEDMKIWYKEN